MFGFSEPRRVEALRYESKLKGLKFLGCLWNGFLRQLLEASSYGKCKDTLDKILVNIQRGRALQWATWPGGVFFDTRILNTMKASIFFFSSFCSVVGWVVISATPSWCSWVGDTAHFQSTVAEICHTLFFPLKVSFLIRSQIYMGNVYL